jgi:hypothetical protein
MTKALKVAVWVVLLGAVVRAHAADTVHVAIHRHLHQPVYWGEPDDIRPNQSQFGDDSQRRKNAGLNWYGGTQQNPENQLVGGENSVFEKQDRIQAYQNWIRSSVGSMGSSDAGMTISFSGALQRNLWSFGRSNSYGYSTGWNANNSVAQGWRTSGGSARADMMGMTYNHALSPLLPRSVLRKQIEMHRERTRKSWGMSADFSDHSKGFWPVEMAFSEAMIPVLQELGYEWVLVANSHVARTVQNYEQKALAAGLLLADPPNRADLLGPTVPDDQWYSANRDTYGNAFPVPYAYQPAWVKYVDPATTQEFRIVAVPSCDYHGYQSGYSPVGWDYIDGKIAQYNDPARPSLVMLANDGENYWGGGSSFWNEFAPQFMNEAPGHGGKKATTVQQYLLEHPVPAGALIHVEDGSWLASDQGSPQFYRWIEPPRRIGGVNPNDPTTYFDVENGWHVDLRNWAVLLAGVNWCETAERIVGPGNVLSWRIEEPYQDAGAANNPNAAERAWHFLMWGFDSGFMYYGVGLDDEVKQTFAANRAVGIARPVVEGGADLTPPTVFKPQRFPWNPGGRGRGQHLNGRTVGYTTPPWPSDFWIWTLVYDVSTTAAVTLKVRVDGDGVNPLNDHANETYAGGPGVGAWIDLPMTRKSVQKTDPFGDPNINFFVLPGEIADRWWAKVEGYRGKLLDYYVEAVDGLGNGSRSEVQHVYVEDDGTPGEQGSDASFSPDPRDCAPLAVTFAAGTGPLQGVSPLFQQISFDGGTNWSRFEMSPAGTNVWVYTNSVPDNAPAAIVWFENTNGSIVDSNGGLNWRAGIRDCDAPSGPGAAATAPEQPVGCDPVEIRYYPNAGVLQPATQILIHVGRNGWQDIEVPDPVMIRVSNYWSHVYTPTVGTYVVDAVFNNGAGVWDNHSSQDWHFPVSECVPPSVPDGIVITNPASDIVVSNEVTAFNLSGTAGTNVSGVLAWTNELTGVGGIVSASAAWTVPNMALTEGTNAIGVSGVIGAAEPIVDAADSAADAAYSPGWESGDNGGSGWGAWQLATNGLAGWFRASTASNTNLDIGAEAWGLWASAGGLSEALRPLGAPLVTGQTFSVNVENNWIESGGSVGIALQSAGGDNLFQFIFFGGATNYTIFDSAGARDSGIAYTAAGLALDFELTAPTNYRFAAGASVVVGSLAASADSSIGRFRAYTYQAGSGPNYDLFINELAVTRPGEPFVTGDTVRIARLPPALHDGIPLSWWNRYGLGTNATAGANEDGDPARNWEEYAADTDPTNAASFFDNVIPATAGAFVLLLSVGPPTTNSRVYDVWFNSDLPDGAWLPMNLDIPGAGDGAAVILSVTNDADGRIYRTGVKLP